MKTGRNEKKIKEPKSRIVSILALQKGEKWLRKICSVCVRLKYLNFSAPQAHLCLGKGGKPLS